MSANTFFNTGTGIGKDNSDHIVVLNFFLVTKVLVKVRFGFV